MEAVTGSQVSTQPEDCLPDTERISTKLEEEKAMAGSDGDAKKATARRTKVVDVSREYIECLLAERAARPPRRRPYLFLSDEAIDAAYKGEEREKVRRMQANTIALLEKSQAREDEILHQFELYGRAKEVIEISDGEEDEDVEE